MNGTIIRNTATNRPQYYTGQEIVGKMTFLNNTEFEAIGSQFPIGEYALSPIAYPGTRLSDMANTFQKYRFRRGTEFVIQTQAPTISTGGYCCGFTENADQSMGVGTAATNNISNLPGAISGPVWESLTTPIAVGDQSKWYNIDSDSQELMNTTQGKFVFQQTAPVSVLGDGSARLYGVVWLRYVIEFTGNCSQADNDKEAPVILPPGMFVAPTGSTDTKFNGWGLKFNNASTITNGLLNNTLYRVTPGIETVKGEAAEFIWTYTYGSSLGGYLLATSEDNAKNGLYLSNQEATGDTNELRCTGGECVVIWSGAPVVISRTVEFNIDLSDFKRGFNTKTRKDDTVLQRRIDELERKISSMLRLGNQQSPNERV